MLQTLSIRRFEQFDGKHRQNGSEVRRLSAVVGSSLYPLEEAGLLLVVRPIKRVFSLDRSQVNLGAP